VLIKPDRDPGHWLPILRSYAGAFLDRIELRATRIPNRESLESRLLKGKKKAICRLFLDGSVVQIFPAPDREIVVEDIQEKASVWHANNDAGGFRVTFGPQHLRMVLGDMQLLGEDEAGQETILFQPDWDFAITDNSAKSGAWSISQAEAEADDYVLSVITGHLLGVPNAKKDELIGKLRSQILDFELLLNTDPTEEQVQAFLTKNPILLHPTAASIFPKHKLGAEMVTDFVIQEANGEYVLVELERPGISIFTKAGDFGYEFGHGFKQVEDWLDWVGTNISYAQQSLPEILEPRGLLVIGRSHSWSRAQKRALAARNRQHSRIRVATFDDLLNAAKQHVTRLSNIQS
jgi:hypothetical protein